jgi:biopolymer transport protein ExbD
MPKVHVSGGGYGRGRRGQRVSMSLSEINVVPLVDVMLVLLIIFMVAAPMMQRGVDVNLPVARRSPQVNEERLFITVPLSFGSDRFVQIDDERVRVDVLAERMRQAMLTKNEKEVFLRGDGGVTLQQLMEVMDHLKAGGVEKVGIVSRLPGER